MEEYTLIQESNFEKARKKIKESEKKIIFSSENDELNRKILEKEKIDILLINQKGRKDPAKQRNSGLNQVLAKLAKKSGVAIGINLDEIIEEKDKFHILARIIQNIKLCNKNNLKMKFIAKRHIRDIYDIKALGLILRMPTKMAKTL